tara:strand:- start:461 stop:628 length:168 start_codon:yes stop_codon:yes gene_type:complete
MKTENKLKLPHIDTCILLVQMFPALAAGTIYAFSLLAKDRIKYSISKRLERKKGE